MTEEIRYQHLIRQDCPLPAGTPVMVYCRDSGGEEQERSVGQQIEVAKEYCRVHGLILEHVYRDDAKVSTNTEKRDELKAMLAEVRKRFKLINDRGKREVFRKSYKLGLIFWKSNRLGRDSLEASHIRTDIRMRGITIIDLITSANTGNQAMDSLIEAFQQWQDEQTLEEMSQNIQRGLVELVTLRDNDPGFKALNPQFPETGGYLGILPGHVPAGFKAERIAIGIRENSTRRAREYHYAQRIVPNHEDGSWERSRRAWEMRIEGRTLAEILKETQLFKTVAGFSRFFKNRIYIGELSYGGRIYKDFVPALIPEEWFELEQARSQEVKKKLQKQKTKKELEPRRITSRHLLSGLVYCGAIDGHEHAMSADTSTTRGGKFRNDYYVCNTMKKSRGQACSAKRVNARRLDAAVISAIITNILNVETLSPIAQKIAQGLNERNDDIASRMKIANSKLTKVNNAIENLTDSIEELGLSPTLKKRLLEREEEAYLINREIQQLMELATEKRDIPQHSTEQLADWIEILQTELLEGDHLVVREILKTFIEKIVVSENDGKIFYTFARSEILGYVKCAWRDSNPRLFAP